MLLLLLLCAFMATVWFLHNSDTTKTLIVRTSEGNIKQ